MSGEAASFWAEGAMAPALSDREKQLRDRFVSEYLIDFDQVAACLRVGFMASMAAEWSQKLMDEPYVRQKITAHMNAVADDPKLEAETTKRHIRAELLKQAHYRGPGASHSARVTALSKLAAFYGMDAPVTTKLEHLHRGGVMAVPGIATVDDWQAAATKSQENLAKDSEVT